jgi:hypothetical protein
MKIILLAKSSSGGSYNVEFHASEGTIRVLCHCQAGVQQWMCKHKLALIKGDNAMLFDPKQASLLSEVHSWPEFDDLKSRAADYEKKLREIETAKSELAAREKELKHRFAHGLTHGFK